MLAPLAELAQKPGHLIFTANGAALTALAGLAQNIGYLKLAALAPLAASAQNIRPRIRAFMMDTGGVGGIFPAKINNQAAALAPLAQWHRWLEIF